MYFVTRSIQLIVLKALIVSNDRFLHKVLIRGFSSQNHAQMFKDSNGLNNAIIIRK